MLWLFINIHNIYLSTYLPTRTSFTHHHNIVPIIFVVQIQNSREKTQRKKTKLKFFGIFVRCEKDGQRKSLSRSSLLKRPFGVLQDFYCLLPPCGAEMKTSLPGEVEGTKDPWPWQRPVDDRVGRDDNQLKVRVYNSDKIFRLFVYLRVCGVQWVLTQFLGLSLFD